MDKIFHQYRVVRLSCALSAPIVSTSLYLHIYGGETGFSAAIHSLTA